MSCRKDHRPSLVALDDDFRVSIAQSKEFYGPQRISTKETLLRHVSRLKIRSKRGNVDSKNTYGLLSTPSLARPHHLLLRHSSNVLCKSQWTCPNHSRMLLRYVSQWIFGKQALACEWSVSLTSNDGRIRMPARIPNACLPCASIPSALRFVVAGVQVRVAGPRVMCCLINVNFTR